MTTKQYEKECAMSERISYVGIIILFLTFMYIVFYTLVIQSELEHLAKHASLSIVGVIAGWWLIYFAVIKRRAARKAYLDCYYADEEARLEAAYEDKAEEYPM